MYAWHFIVSILHHKRYWSWVKACGSLCDSNWSSKQSWPYLSPPARWEGKRVAKLSVASRIWNWDQLFRCSSYKLKCNFMGIHPLLSFSTPRPNNFGHPFELLKVAIHFFLNLLFYFPRECSGLQRNAIRELRNWQFRTKADGATSFHSSLALSRLY